MVAPTGTRTTAVAPVVATPETSPEASEESVVVRPPTSRECTAFERNQGKLCTDEHHGIRADEIELGPKIGEGQTARVYKAVCRGKDVAVKVMQLNTSDEDTIGLFKQEIEIMGRVSHPNVCLYMGSCTSVPTCLAIVTPLYKTSLDAIIFDPTVDMTCPLRVRIACDVAVGMNWLHAMTPKLIHSDLKCSNILLDENYHAVVSDFGQTQILNCVTKGLVYGGGSPLYMAPEKLMGVPHNEKVDVYAFGLVLWEIIHRQKAFAHYNRGVSIATFQGAVCDEHERPPIAKDCPASLASLIEACWQHSPNLRPDFTGVVTSLRDIGMEVTIPDPLGRKLWLDHFGREGQVPWKLFKEQFTPFLTQRTSTPRHRSMSLFWLKPLLTQRMDHSHESLTTALGALAMRQNTPKCGFLGPEKQPSGTELFVTCEQFGNVLSYFGPIDMDPAIGTLVDRVQAVLSSSWFHGDIDSTDAFKLLRADGRVGAYLIRLSGRESGTFTLSRVCGDARHKDITHQRIRHHNPGGFVWAGECFRSLPELISRISIQYQLRHPVAGSKYATLVDRWHAKMKKATGEDDFTEDTASGHEGFYSDHVSSPTLATQTPFQWPQ